MRSRDGRGRIGRLRTGGATVPGCCAAAQDTLAFEATGRCVLPLLRAYWQRQDQYRSEAHRNQGSAIEEQQYDVVGIRSMSIKGSPYTHFKRALARGELTLVRLAACLASDSVSEIWAIIRPCRSGVSYPNGGRGRHGRAEQRGASAQADALCPGEVSDLAAAVDGGALSARAEIARLEETVKEQAIELVALGGKERSGW